MQPSGQRGRNRRPGIRVVELELMSRLLGGLTSVAQRTVPFRALRLLLDVQPFSSASQAGPRAVDRPHPPVPDRRSHRWRHHRRQGTSGHVWQGRFRSPVIQDGNHLLVVLRYIEANPVRAAMVADPCEYTWSSHRCHGAGHADPILDSFPEWEPLGRTEPERRARWRRKVRGEQPAKELDGVRSSVRSGRPYGAEDWVEVISHSLGIVREPRRRGRPPREKDALTSQQESSGKEDSRKLETFQMEPCG